MTCNVEFMACFCTMCSVWFFTVNDMGRFIDSLLDLGYIASIMKSFHPDVEVAPFDHIGFWK
jgi:hypothetical protein